MSYSVTMFPAIGGLRWIEVLGEVTGAAAADLREMTRVALIHPRSERITVDLRRATGIDAAVAASLAELADIAAASGRTLVTIQAGTPVAAPHAGAAAPVAVPDPVVVAATVR